MTVEMIEPSGVMKLETVVKASDKLRGPIALILRPDILAERDDFIRALGGIDSGDRCIVDYPGYRNACQEVYRFSAGIMDNITRRMVYRAAEKVIGFLGEIDDVYQWQRERLWKLISVSFRWPDYTGIEEKAASAFIAYMKKFGLHGLLSTQIGLQNEISDPKDHPTDILSDPLHYLLAQESWGNFCRAVESWAKTHDESVVQAILSRYWDEITIKEIAERSGVPIEVVKNRIEEGKRSLAEALYSSGQFGPSRGITSGGPGFIGSQRQLLELRREMYASRYETMVKQNLLPPKIALVLSVYYGFEGCEPVFNYQKTADQTGLPLSSVRVYLPQGLRLLVGSEFPSQRAITAQQNKRLYDRWVLAPDTYMLTPNQAEALEKYFGQRKSQREIAAEMGISPVTVSRLVTRGLNLIRLVTDKNDPNRYGSGR